MLEKITEPVKEQAQERWSKLPKWFTTPLEWLNENSGRISLTAAFCWVMWHYANGTLERTFLSAVMWVGSIIDPTLNSALNNL